MATIGSDEVGTGDYFGPIVVSATYVSKENIDSNLTPLSSEITGERIQTVISVMVFRTLEHLRLVSLFSRFYCKGKEK